MQATPMRPRARAGTRPMPPATPTAAPLPHDLPEATPPNASFAAGDLLDAPADAICNPVNLAGVMGRGLALQFRTRWPAELPRLPRRAEKRPRSAAGASTRTACPTAGTCCTAPPRTTGGSGRRSPWCAPPSTPSAPAAFATASARSPYRRSAAASAASTGPDVRALLLAAATRHSELRWLLYRAGALRTTGHRPWTAAILAGSAAAPGAQRQHDPMPTGAGRSHRGRAGLVAAGQARAGNRRLPLRWPPPRRSTRTGTPAGASAARCTIWASGAASTSATAVGAWVRTTVFGIRIRPDRYAFPLD